MTTITYTATINLGNYESERIEITAEVDNADGSPAAVIEALREHVDKSTVSAGWLGRLKKPAQAPRVASVREVQTDPFAGLEE